MTATTNGHTPTAVTGGGSEWPPAPQAAYCLRGPQVEPSASKWTEGPTATLPCVIRMSDLIAVTDQKMIDGEANPWFFPPYPDEDTTQAEIEELLELAALRDDPGALVSNVPGRKRRKISPFLQLRPQPFGAVYNTERPASEPVIRTGRELARWFESETPGLGHRHALNYLIRDANWSPPRQARVWMALDVAIYSAILAAWHYKWRTQRTDLVRYRPRPYEFDYRVDVLFNHAVNATGSGDGARRLSPDPSPGTPRHPAYPSGHSTVGGAASEILSYFFPDYTADFDDLADNAGMARLWAGIHYRSDHEAGVLLGRAVARLIIDQLQSDGVPPADTPGLAPNYELWPPTQAEVDATAVAEFGKLGMHAKNGASSMAAMQENAHGPQEGAPAFIGTVDLRRQARSANEGAPLESSESETRDRAGGPQEGTQ